MGQKIGLYDKIRDSSLFLKLILPKQRERLNEKTPKGDAIV